METYEEIIRYLSALIGVMYSILQIVFYLYKNHLFVSSLFKGKRISAFNELKSNNNDSDFVSLWDQEIECEYIKKAYGIRITPLQLKGIKQLYTDLSNRFTFEQLLGCGRFICYPNDEVDSKPMIQMKRWERYLWLFCLFLTIFALLLTSTMIIVIYSHELYKVESSFYYYLVFLFCSLFLFTTALNKFFDYFWIRKIIKYQDLMGMDK